MAYAALLSGICLANAGLGAVHGLASPLGALLPIPHGIACGAVLWQTVRVTIAALEARAPDSPALARYAEAGRILAADPAPSDGTARAGLVDRLREMVERLGVPPLRSFGMRPTDVAAVVADSPGSSMQTNPLPLTDAELAGILESAL
jgi:alcohol dehydrogenase